MKISELIDKLISVAEEFGDLDVVVREDDWRCADLEDVDVGTTSQELGYVWTSKKTWETEDEHTLNCAAILLNV